MQRGRANRRSKVRIVFTGKNDPCATSAIERLGPAECLQGRQVVLPVFLAFGMVRLSCLRDQIVGRKRKHEDR